MDTTLYVKDCGKGISLVMLHGNGESGDYFKNQTAFFSNRYRVIVPDTRGHGKSGRGSRPLCFKTFSDDLLFILDNAGIEKAHLLGFSDGANTAITFALEHQERLLSLVLNGANLYPEGLTAACRLPITFQYAFWSALCAFSCNAKRKKELFSLMTNEPQIDPRSLGKLRIPSLVIAGTHDMIKRSHTELIASSIPHARSVFIDGSHFVAREKPEIFNRTVLEFLIMNQSSRSL